MLTERTVLARDGLRIADVSCSHEPGRSTGQAQCATEHEVVFVRRGCFKRIGDGAQGLIDTARIYCINPGQEERYAHPINGGDDCTAVTLTPAVAASFLGDEPTLPVALLATTPRIDLEHRLLLGAARRGDDHHELTERAISLVAATVELVEPARVGAARLATGRARRSIVDAAREALAADVDLSLQDLAAALAVSPHHLSRIFRAYSGVTVSRHRMQIRVRAALEALAHGEQRLANLAADLGFSDESHLCRTIRLETGCTPSELRRALSFRRSVDAQSVISRSESS